MLQETGPEEDVAIGGREYVRPGRTDQPRVPSVVP